MATKRNDMVYAHPSPKGFTAASIKELEIRIMQARKDYYNGESKISDKVFDTWIDELAEMDPKNLAVIGIGSEPISNWEKYNHKIPLGSLNKCQTHDEFVSWKSKYANDNELFLTLKLDGLSVSLIYENGALVRASTRGSGSTGELITKNVAQMIGVPLRLPQKIDATIRGEILLSKTNHLKHFSDYSNCRNAASGISRRYDGENVDKLNVLVYQILSDDVKIDTQYDQFKLLEKLGFEVPTYQLLKSADQILKVRDKYENGLRDKYEYDLDGLVIYNNSLEKQTEHGETDNRPKAVIAYKFEAIYKEAYIKEIIPQVGNSGRITPVAIFDPKVNLMGADIERATLHNFSNIEELGVGIGATVLICRSNDVIPFIEEVVNPPKNIFKAPTKCPECDAKLIEQGEYVQCPNVLNCPAQITGRIKNWIKDLNVLEWGDTLLERLVETGRVKTVADLYKLDVSDLSTIERMGQKSAEKCYKILWKNNEIPLDIFFGALSIPMIGSSTIRLIIAAGYDSLEKIQNLTVNNLENISGIGPARAKSLVDGIKINKNLVIDILDSGVKIKKKIMGNLSGKSFCFTGAMQTKRAELEKMAQDKGGEIKSSVGKGLSYLVIADPASTSSKAVKARSLGTTLISEEDFLNMV